MRLAISRRAAPEMPLSRICLLAHARGLDGVEVSEADLTDMDALEEAAAFVVGIHVESPAAIASIRTARVAATLRAPVIAARGALANASLADLDALYRREKAELLVSHATVVDEAAFLVEALANVHAKAVSVAWEVHTKHDDLREAPGVLRATSGALRYIRLRGGGPELADDDVVGTGDLAASVALSGFTGIMTLAPSSDGRIGDWQKWLAGKNKSGCGTAHESHESRESRESRETKAARAKNVALDIRSVEPKDQLDTAMGAYRALAPGRTLHVTFDHDPSCMFYTLQATEPKGSFVFERTGNGPEVWRAEVTKLAV